MVNFDTDARQLRIHRGGEITASTKDRVQQRTEETMTKDYAKIYSHLSELMARLEGDAPGVMEGFGRLHQASVADGVLDTRTKELIALAIGITVRCDGCIAYHVHDALGAGASREEIIETIGVAVMMGGGPSVVYGCEALEAIDRLQSARIA
jgi:AhpD family alkylhydroperoxidase